MQLRSFCTLTNRSWRQQSNIQKCRLSIVRKCQRWLNRKRDGLFRFCAALGARGRQRRSEGRVGGPQREEVAGALDGGGAAAAVEEEEEVGGRGGDRGVGEAAGDQPEGVLPQLDVPWLTGRGAVEADDLPRGDQVEH